MRYALAFATVIGLNTAALAIEMPVPVVSAISEAKKTCSPDVSTLRPGFITRQDVNGDGVSDFILDYGKFRCGDSDSFWCGSAGCTTQVFVSLNGTYVKALDENVQGLRFKKINGRHAMLLGLHGSSCGRAGVQACGASLYWNGSRFSPAN